MSDSVHLIVTTKSDLREIIRDALTRDQSEMISDAYQWRRWESNPRPKTVQNGVYVCSLCFEIRDDLRPQTGSHQR